MSEPASLPEPLVPTDADLRDFSFMPLDLVRLFGSRFHAIANDSEWRAGVTLWCKSFHQVPAGSLPDDDVELCRLAELGRDLKAWKRHRAVALHGWVRCTDGRLYHSVVAEKANEAWTRKQAQRERSRRGNAARWGARGDSGDEPQGGEGAGARSPDRPRPRGRPPGSVQDPEKDSPRESLKDSPKESQRESRKESRNDPKGQEQGYEEREQSGGGDSERSRGSASSAAPPPPPAGGRAEDPIDPDRVVPIRSAAERFDPGEPTREGVVAAWLVKANRDVGRQPVGISSLDPKLRAWIASGVTDREIAEAFRVALEQRQRAKDPGGIGVAFVDLKLRDLRTKAAGGAEPLPASRAVEAWERDDEALKAKAAELGIRIRDEWTGDDVRWHVRQALRGRATA